MPKIEISQEIKNLLDAHLEASRAVNSDEENVVITFSDPTDQIIYLAFSDGDKGAIYWNELEAIMTHIDDICPLCKSGKLEDVFDSERVPVMHLGCNKCYATLVIAGGELCLVD